MIVRRKRVTREACLWLERIERTLRGDEAIRLRKWLARSLHREIIIDRCKIWHGPEVMGVLEVLIPLDVARSRIRLKKRSRAGTFAAVAVAASLVALIIIPLSGWKPWREAEAKSTVSRVDEIYSTVAGERRSVQLPDGSAIALNENSEVVVRYESPLRRVALLRGEARFDVVAEPERAFRLRVDRRFFEVRPQEAAVFNIRRVTPVEMEIAVAKGTLQLFRSQSKEAKRAAEIRNGFPDGDATLQAGEGGTVASNWQNLWNLNPDEVHARLEWQQSLD